MQTAADETDLFSKPGSQIEDLLDPVNVAGEGGHQDACASGFPCTLFWVRWPQLATSVDGVTNDVSFVNNSCFS